MKVTNVLYFPCPKFPQFRFYFEKTPANHGDKVENRSSIRKQDKRALTKVWPQSFDHSSCTRSASNSNQGLPTNKHSQHSHSFSPHRCMVHGVLFAELSLEVGLSSILLNTENFTAPTMYVQSGKMVIINFQ